MAVMSEAGGQRQAAVDPRPRLLEVSGSTRQQVQGVIWFVGLCMALAAIAVVATGAAPALVPFLLAIGPAIIAVGLAWREGHGAVRRLR